MGAADESTDPNRPVAVGARTDPDFQVRPAIEGTDPLAQGGWHSSGGTKATVVDGPAGPTAIVDVTSRTTPPPQGSAQIEVVPATGVPIAQVLVLLTVVGGVAFALGRCTG